MTNINRLKILIVCALVGIESIVFFNAGFFDDHTLSKIGGADGPTSITISGINGFSMLEHLLEIIKGESNGKSEVEEPDETEEQRRIDEERQERLDAEAKGLLILVNKEKHVDSEYKPDDLKSIHYFASDRTEASRYMRAEAADSFHKLVESAMEEGFELVMTTAYRSYGFQQILWKNYVNAEGEEAANRFSAKPGQSEHQTGLAVDVTSPTVDYALTNAFGETDEGKWLAENAHDYGFIIRFPEGKEHITGYLYEPWHLRYVGQAVATQIYNQGVTLEEYLEKPK